MTLGNVPQGLASGGSLQELVLDDSVRSWPCSPSNECSDGLLLRVQEGEVDRGFHGSLAAWVVGNPLHKGVWGREGEKKASGRLTSPPHSTSGYSFPPSPEC